MKYGNHEVLELAVFDGDGKLVANLDTLKYSRVFLSERSAESYIEVQDSLLDEQMLKFIGKEQEDYATDFEKMINGASERTVINIGKKRNVMCKLIANGVLRAHDTGVDKPFRIVTTAVVSCPISIESDCLPTTSVFTWRFNIWESMEGDHLAQLIIG